MAACAACGADGNIGMGGCVLCSVCAAMYEADAARWRPLGGVPRFVAEISGKLTVARSVLDAVEEKEREKKTS